MSKTREPKDSMEAIVAIDFDLQHFDEDELTLDYVRSVIERHLKVAGVDIQILDLQKNKHIFK